MRGLGATGWPPPFVIPGAATAFWPESAHGPSARRAGGTFICVLRTNLTLGPRLSHTEAGALGRG